MSDLVTGEAVPLDLRLAKLPSRALALILDGLLLGAIAIGLLVALVQVDVDTALATAILIGALVFVLVVVPTTIETLTRGKSLGKTALGLRVVRDDGGPIRFRHALARALAGVFADFVLTLGLGAVICSLLNSHDKRIGDLLAGTVVVRERIPATAAPQLWIHPWLASWALSLELSRLSDPLALAARTLLARAPELAPEVRDRLVVEMAGQIAAVVTPPPPPQTPAWIYLTTVLGERRRRDTLRLTGSAEPAPSPPAPPASAPTAPPAPAAPPTAPTPPAPAPPASPSTTANGGGFAPPA